MASSADSRLAILSQHFTSAAAASSVSKVGSDGQNLGWLKISPEVSEALKHGSPIVALESTIISHGMPYPQNFETAKELEVIVRENGAVPATIAILDGVPCIGLTTEELEILARLGSKARKTASRDIALVMAGRENKMAFSSLSTPGFPLLLHFQKPKLSFFTSNLQTPFDPFPQLSTINPRHHQKMSTMKAQASVSDLGIVERAIQLVQSSPPTWQSALLSNIIIFAVGSPLLVSGLSLSGIGAAFLLGTLTWRAFGSSGFLLVATYFVIGTAATKVKMAQKEAQGVAEKRKGRRGPGSVIGSSAAGCVCAFLSINGVGGEAFTRLWELAFVASFCTKLSDTVSSEIGKAYGKTTYLVTTFKVVPRGTEGAVSAEGTFAGLLASVLLAFVGYLKGQINLPGAAICVIAAQIANFGESLIGASFQEKEGFRWLNNDVVNVINISLGSILAVLMQKIILQS